MNERTARGIAAQQNKVGGAVIGQFMHGVNKLSPTSTLESSNFETGSTGFQLTGEGAAEFGDMTVRGTITGATLVGTFKTSASGARMEIYDNGTYSQIDMYAGIASESPGEISTASAAGKHRLRLRNGKVGGTAAEIVLDDTVARDVFIDSGNTGGTYGAVKLQAAGSGAKKISGRGYDMAPFLNVPTQSTGTIAANQTISSTTLTFGSNAPALYMQAQTISLVPVGGTPGLYYGTYPTAFTTGVLALTVTLVRDWAILLIGAPAPNYTCEIAHDITVAGTPLATFYVFVYDDTGAAVTAGLACSFIAVGW